MIEIVYCIAMAKGSCPHGSSAMAKHLEYMFVCMSEIRVTFFVVSC